MNYLRTAVIASKILTGASLTFTDYCDIMTANISLGRYREMLDYSYRNIPSKERFENLMNFVDIHVPCERQNPRTRENVIRRLIGVLADKMRVDAVLRLTRTKQIENFYEPGYRELLSRLMKLKGDASKVSQTFYKDCLISPTPHRTIDLATYPVIPLIWQQDRTHRALAEIGTEDNPWEQKKDNHKIAVLEPLNVAFTISGNHSILSGAQSRTGVITTGPDTLGEDHMNEVYDLTKLYEAICYDGEFYRWRDGQSDGEWGPNCVAAKASSHDFGCMFELGRLLLDKEQGRKTTAEK